MNHDQHNQKRHDHCFFGRIRRDHGSNDIDLMNNVMESTMSKNRSNHPVRIRKERIRKRDRRRFKKRLVCTLCGRITKTEIHHWYYSDIFDERSIIEVCPKCHKILHGIGIK